ncbi:MAG: BglG family transcription antiterminator [Clostridium cadaveris]|uniref:BglG family transcription antiterminator n=1 Tax=Clostridium cadaveris TaxID=1529 RepID=UPI002A8FAFA2|nr:BglG family transcription antiterminator [Clostridium cadaveris]
MVLNKDCIDILKYMWNKDDYVSISEFAEMYKVTNRAIRYKIDKIEDFLVTNGFDYLEKQHSKGVKIIKTKDLKKFIGGFLAEHTPYKYVYSKEERFEFMVIKLLQSSNPINLSYFEKTLCLSKNTVLKEINEVESWLKTKGITLIRKPRVGIQADGDEINKRKAIIDITSETMSSEDLLNYVSRKMVQSKINNLQFDILFADIDVDFLDIVIREAECELKKEFSDEAYGGLITHLSIMIKRVQLHKDIYLPNVNEEMILYTEEYRVANEMIERIEKHFKIEVPEGEKSYIVIHLLGAKVLKDDNLYKNAGHNIGDLRDIVIKITEEIENLYGVQFGEERQKLIDDLVLHLRPSIYRMKYGSKLVNPMFEEIKMSYRELFYNVKAAMVHLEKYIGTVIDEQEISYVVIHYAAALRNLEERTSKKARVVLVCGTGIGTAKMLSTKIQSKFQVDVVATTASRNIDALGHEDYDYIISTVDIPQLNKDQYIKISALLLEKDCKKLEKYLNLKLKADNSFYEAQLVKRLIGIIEKHCTIRDENTLKYELLYELKKEYEYKKEDQLYVLRDLIKSDTVKLKCNCKDYKEALYEGCKLLIDKNIVSERYYEEVLNNIDTYGPYIVIAPGIALSHANVPEDVKGTAMSIVNLKYPVKFNHATNDPVRLIITFATEDDEKHLNALSQLMSLFNNTEDLNEMMHTSSKEKVLEIINKYSK